MLTSTLEIMSDRREFLGINLAAMMSSAVAPAMAATRKGLDLTNPQDHVDIFRKFSASAEDGAEVIVHYSGVTFGMVDDTRAIPLYGMEGISPVRSFRLPDGTVRYLAREIAQFTDLATGEVLETWRNPFTDETVEVWPLRNGPLNYSLSPNSPVDSGGWKMLTKPPGPAPAAGFYVPVFVEGDDLIMALDAQASRKSPLSPEEWPRESNGANLVYSEHNTWKAKVSDMENADLPTIPVFAAWHSIKPWRPWMLMGQKPGRIYNHLRARKLKRLEDAPKKLLAHNEKHFPEFLSAPKEWNGAYEDDWTHFKRQRKPKA
jgi:Protein of unknown function (DUF1838)